MVIGSLRGPSLTFFTWFCVWLESCIIWIVTCRGMLSHRILFVLKFTLLEHCGIIIWIRVQTCEIFPINLSIAVQKLKIDSDYPRIFQPTRNGRWIIINVIFSITVYITGISHNLQRIVPKTPICFFPWFIKINRLISIRASNRIWM